MNGHEDWQGCPNRQSVDELAVRVSSMNDDVADLKTNLAVLTGTMQKDLEYIKAGMDAMSAVQTGFSPACQSMAAAGSDLTTLKSEHSTRGTAFEELKLKVNTHDTYFCVIAGVLIVGVPIVVAIAIAVFIH